MNIDTSETLTDSFFLRYGIAAYALCGLLVAIFAIGLINNSSKIPVFLFAVAANLYFALAIWVGGRKFGNFGIALLGAIIPFVLALTLKFQYLVPILSVFYLFVFARETIKLHAGHHIRVSFVWVSTIAVAYSFVVLASPQLTDVFFTSKMLVGQFNTDSFFHIAIASMIEHFGVSSIGAHGLIPVEYYTFSHYFFAAAAYITGISVVDSYASMYSIVLIPLLLLALSGAAESIQRSRTSTEYFFRLFLIGLIFVGFLGYGPGSLSTRYAMWPSYFESESYTLSLIFLLVMLSMLNVEHFGKQFVGICVCLILMCLTKASTAIIAYGIFVAHLVFSPAFSYRRRALFVGVATVSVAITLKIMSPQVSEVLQFNYFDFVRQYVLNEPAISQGNYLADYRFWVELLKFLGVHFFFSWACFALLANGLRHQSENRILAGKALIYNSVALLAAFIAVIFMVLPAGAVYYFTNVSMFVAIPFVVIYAARGCAEAKINCQVQSKRNVVPLIFICIGAIGLLVQAPTLIRALKNKTMQSQPTSETAKFESYLNQLTSIRNAHEGKKMLVYIAKENAGFWQAPITASCLAPTFAIVAVSEHPAVFGLPDKARCKVAYYGFNSYPEHLYASSARPRITHEELIREVRNLGFDGYYDVSQTEWKVFYVE